MLLILGVVSALSIPMLSASPASQPASMPAASIEIQISRMPRAPLEKWAIGIFRRLKAAEARIDELQIKLAEQAVKYAALEKKCSGLNDGRQAARQNKTAEQTNAGRAASREQPRLSVSALAGVWEAPRPGVFKEFGRLRMMVMSLGKSGVFTLDMVNLSDPNQQIQTSGRWHFASDELSLEGNNGSSIFEIVSFDGDALTCKTSGGSTINWHRKR